jgi:predicted MFS family arabinose efflux permease
MNSSATKANWLVPFAGAVFAMMTMQMSSLGFSALLPAIQKDFAINFSQMGLFTGMYGLIAMVVSLPGGMLAQRFGERRMLSLGLAGIAAGLLCLSLAPNFAWGLAARALWLVGYRLAFVCVMTAVALTAPAALRSSAMGIVGAFSSLASVIGAPFGSLLENAFGWRQGILGFGVMAALGLLVFSLGYRRVEAATSGGILFGHGAVAGPSAPPAGTTRSPYRTPVVWAMVLLGLVNMAGFSATFFVPSAVKTIFQLRPIDAAFIISTSYIAAIVANLLIGYLSDRFNRWHVMISLMLVLIPSTFAMTTHNLPLFRCATALVISLGLAATNQIYAIAREVVKGQDMGSVMGIVSLGGGIFGYIGPQILGYLRDRTGGFLAGWYFVAAGTLIGLVVILALKRYAERLQTAVVAAPVSVAVS